MPWPVRGYRLYWDNNKSNGYVELDLDRDPKMDERLHLESPAHCSAILLILQSGKAAFENGVLMASNS